MSHNWSFYNQGGPSFTKEEWVYVLLDSEEFYWSFYCGFIWLLRRPDTLDSVPLSLVLSYCVLEYGGIRLSSMAWHVLPSTLAAEFTYNNAPSATMGISPFFMNKGYHPWLAVDSSTLVTSVGAQQFTANLDSVHTELKANIAATQEHYQKSANWHWAPALDFQLGDCHGTTSLLSFPIFVCPPPHLRHLPTPSDLVHLPSATSAPTPRCTHATVLHPCSD